MAGHADHEKGPHAHPGQELTGHEDTGQEGQAEGEPGKAALQRGEVQDVLVVEDHQEEDRLGDADQQDRQAVAQGSDAFGEEAEGASGCVLLAWDTTNATRSMNPTAIEPADCHSGTPEPEDSSPFTSAMRPTVSRPAPVQSIRRRPGALFSGTRRRITRSGTAAARAEDHRERCQPIRA
jgi:hypothetical protein